MERDDISEIAKLHKSVFSNTHFSTIFPSKLLLEYFNKLFSHHTFKFVAVEDSQVIGYLMGGVNPDVPVNQFLRGHFFYIALILLRNLRFLVEKIQDFFSLLFNKGLNVHANTVSIYLIAVSIQTQNRGVGRELLKHFEMRLLENSVLSYTLAVRSDNQKAIDFYLKNNFVEIGRDYKTISFKKLLK
ncbi:MAG: GNAT family N-acetyltransferase [Ignavibacteriales bacterium]|nr:MAG: GNAT family N-acetyltransferase [Ignavibacteriales bacterium]